MEPQQTKQSIQQNIIALMRVTRKTDPLFRPLKKLKSALQSVGFDMISSTPSPKILLFHFGLGNELDLEMIRQTNIQSYLFNESQSKQSGYWNPILPGKSYSIIEFASIELSCSYFMKQFSEMLSEPMKHNINTNFRYTQVRKQNLTRILIATFCSKTVQSEQSQFIVTDCPQNYHNEIPGLFLIPDFINRQQQLDLLKAIDSGKWERLNNRRVQHFGYQFKYGRNTVDKQQSYNKMPEFIHPVIYKLKKLQLIPDELNEYDQMTINDYFPGDGIPPHFDTHSPFQQYFVAISLLSSLVMEFRKYDGHEHNLYLKHRSLMIFSGQGRYAWTHGIACRKLDKIDGQFRHRARRISLTLRKIRRQPCVCPYYFYCDSQGYDQSTMKKNHNNPLLKKYLVQHNSMKLSELQIPTIYKKYVIGAYNGFGYNFHNKIILPIKQLVEQDLSSRIKEELHMVLDIGCGNGEYKAIIDKFSNTEYFGIQLCENMQVFVNKIHMDGLQLAFRAEIFEVVLCVAVLHHLPSHSMRLRMLNQIEHILVKKGGYAYISVFELNQPIYGTQNDILLQYCVPEHKIKKTGNQPSQVRRQQRGQIYDRYYHLFTQQQLTNLIHQTNLIIVDLKHDHENIVIKVTKN